jgi:hypothetical protein
LEEIHTEPTESAFAAAANNKMNFACSAMLTGPAFIKSTRSASSKPSSFWRFDSTESALIARFRDGSTTPCGLNSALCSEIFCANLSRIYEPQSSSQQWN